MGSDDGCPIGFVFGVGYHSFFGNSVEGLVDVESPLQSFGSGSVILVLYRSG